MLSGPRRQARWWGRWCFASELVLAGSLLAGVGHATELNSANQAELEQVKGVGPQLSGRLLEERRHGPFRDWADLIHRMKGVGPASASKLSAGGLTVAGQAYLPPGGVATLSAASAASAARPVATAIPAAPPAASEPGRLSRKRWAAPEFP